MANATNTNAVKKIVKAAMEAFTAEQTAENFASLQTAISELEATGSNAKGVVEMLENAKAMEMPATETAENAPAVIEETAENAESETETANIAAQNAAKAFLGMVPASLSGVPTGELTKQEIEYGALGYAGKIAHNKAQAKKRILEITHSAKHECYWFGTTSSKNARIRTNAEIFAQTVRKANQKTPTSTQKFIAFCTQETEWETYCIEIEGEAGEVEKKKLEIASEFAQKGYIPAKMKAQNHFKAAIA